MLKKYESPELEVIELENRDVIVSSDLDGDNGVDPGDSAGSDPTGGADPGVKTEPDGSKWTGYY